jgi:hypothetical protein
MKRTTHNHKPRQRTSGLVVETLSDETLVYDLDRDKAHCLNQTASLVWRRCDGKNTPKQIARAVSLDLKHSIDEKFVWLALDQLRRNNLLTNSPGSLSISGVSRREVMKTLAVSAAVALPLVASIVAPVPAQAASCKPNGQGCESGAECCSGFCSGTCGPPPP